MDLVKEQVAGAKQVGGVWLPAGETHLVEMMETRKEGKNYRIVDGLATYQYFKLEAAMRDIPAHRRRNCIDIGAHVGLWSMWLALEFKHVFAFEPMPLHATILPHNMRSQNYTLFQTALGDKHATAKIGHPPGTSGNAHVEDFKTSAGPVVTVSPLDSFDLAHIDFIKIDVEGYELKVVRGAKETLLRERPYVILEQKGNDQKFYGEEAEAALKYCVALGMKAKWCMSGDWFLAWE